VLRGLSLTLKPNESVALVGESGCGKSTIVSLLLRFYDVNFGRILLDGKDIREYPVKELRAYMGLV
jgi:ABC-type multidrug transport system fused ATPase/permease subunit